MTSTLVFRRDDRLLVLAPHPDDETLATGGILQGALAAGAEVRVVIASDGDNNPWPQRWLERRWRIDAGARARWGRRRREESRRALEILGVPAEAVRHLGWPDLGMTAQLMEGPLAERVLAEELATFAPTHLAAPMANDHHPDHNALAILIELALAVTPAVRPRRLGYLVHGLAPAEAADACTFPGSDAQRRRKREAVMAHATQVSLSERRLLAIAAREERFIAANVSPALPRTFSLRVPMTARLPWVRHELLLVTLGGGAVRRVRLQVSAAMNGESVSEHDGLRLRMRRVGGGVEVDVASEPPLERGFIKLARSGSRLVIYDCAGWTDFTQCLAERLPEALAGSALPR